MTIPGPMFVLLAAALPVVVGVFVFWFVPQHLRSVLRYELWRIRDNAVDDILSGELLRSPAALRLVHDIECSIVAISKLTYLDLLMLRFMPRDVMEAIAGEFDELQRELTPRERGTIRNYYQAYHNVITRLKYVSMSGWILSPIVALVDRMKSSPTDRRNNSRRQNKIIAHAIGARVEPEECDRVTACV